MSKQDPFLDSCKNNRNTFCGRWSVAGTVEHEGRKYRHVARLGCKSWGCSYCGPRRARQLRNSIIERAQENQLHRFLTLTLDPRSCPPEKSTEHIKKTWAKMRTYFKRKFGQSIDYIAITEFQKSGYAHMHILIDRYIPQAWVQQAWMRLGGGKFVNIKFVDIHRIASYLSKYLTKELFLAGFKPGTRRFSSSRNIRLISKAPLGTWELIKADLETVLLGIAQPLEDLLSDENGRLQWVRIDISL